jgi:menaquinol-cytochrome c reductase iron-sulfur subunit
MKAAIIGIGGLISAAYAIPAIGYIIGPAIKQGSSDWIKLGPISKVELNVPTLFKTVIQSQTGWITAEEEISAYVLSEDGQTYVVMSNICTHLGCKIRWIAEKNGFFCPCHNGAFSKDGAVTGGPPPRPLDRFESKVEEDILYVKRG